ncbi:MAG: family 20 glycosylhydrolase [Bacteroidota bacterium]
MLKSLFILAFILLSVFGFSQESDSYYGIIPAPTTIKKGSGEFVFDNNTLIIADSNDNAVKYLIHHLRNEDLNNRVIKNEKLGTTTTQASLVITSTGADNIPAEGYRLYITSKKIFLQGKGAGLFYGIETLFQLMPNSNAGAIHLPCLTIEDFPRFSYRGLHLDVSRHFFPVSFIKEYIDLMAAFKLNTFHWHLTDDQGWRIEIKKYPKLTQIGSLRAQTKVGSYEKDGGLYDNTPYSGFYTQEQIKEVVDYATERFITIVPEIEMPGHSLAAIASYPELSCDPKELAKVAETWGVFTNVYCPTDYTFKFLENVLTEVMALFPGKYIHIGGDECPKDAWKASTYCQQFIKDNNLKDENGLQSYFIQRIEKFINSKGRSIIGWDEILDGGLAPNAMVMSWRGEQGGIDAAQQGHDVIMTPGSSGLYFDHKQSKSKDEPLSIGGNAPLEKTYAYDPIPFSLAPEQQKHIIGVQANVWTEYISTPAKVEYMLLPRLLALSEIAWSPKENKNFKQFYQLRVSKHLSAIDAEGFNYRVPTAIGATDTTMTGSQFQIELQSPVENAAIYYTIDGYPPRETDLQYTYPLNFNITQGQQIELQTIVITASGKRSLISHTILSNK